MSRDELLSRISVDPNTGAEMSRERFVDIPVKKTA
jgi:hypothetical protein